MGVFLGDEIGPALAEHVKVLILIGATSDKIQEALDAEIIRPETVVI